MKPVGANKKLSSSTNETTETFIERVLSMNKQKSSNLEKKSILIGGVIKKIISPKEIKSGLATPMKSLLNANTLKTLVKPTNVSGQALLKSFGGQAVKPLRLLRSPQSLLKPIKPKPMSESSGTFIKLSDLQGVFPKLVSKKSAQSSPHATTALSVSSQVPSPQKATLKFVPKQVLAASQSHLVRWGRPIQPRPLLGSSLRERPPVPSLLSDNPSDWPRPQKQVHLMPVASPPPLVPKVPLTLTPLLVKKSPTSVHSSLPSSSSPVILNATTPAYPKSPISSTALKCPYCHLVFMKPESLRIHKVSRHLDKLKPLNESPVKRVMQKFPNGGKPVFLSLKNGKPQLQNVFIIPSSNGVNNVGSPSLNTVGTSKISPNGNTGKKDIIPTRQSPTPSVTVHGLMTLADLLELERELGDHSYECIRCQGGQVRVAQLKYHARIHPLGDENCDECRESAGNYKMYMAHLETHAPDSESDCEFVSEL